MPDQSAQHLTIEELEAAITPKTARVACSKGDWRLVIHGGLKYSCVSSLVSIWASPAGNHPSDYRGRKTVWAIKSVEPDTGCTNKKPRQAMPLDQLIPNLKRAIALAVDGRWNQSDWRLVSPENICALIKEIDRVRLAQKAA